VSDDHAARKPFWPTAPVLVGLVVILGAVVWCGVVLLARARDSADGSCLSSLHAALARSGKLDPARDTASWRTWSRDEVDAAISGLQGYGDCDSSPSARWRAILMIRSRKAGTGPEIQLWLRGRPHVSSPWRAEGAADVDGDGLNSL
jgi:hypothetical protein